jgi:hypothetical protein
MSNYRIERELPAGVFVLYHVPKDINHSLEFFNSFPAKSLQDPKNIRQGEGAFVLKWMSNDLVESALCCYGCMKVWYGLSVLLL